MRRRGEHTLASPQQVASSVNVDYHPPVLENSKCNVDEATWFRCAINDAYLSDISHFLSTTSGVFVSEARMDSSIDAPTKLPKQLPPSPLSRASRSATQSRCIIRCSALVARRIALINRLSISLAISVVPSSFF